MAQTSDTALGLNQDTPTLDALAPSTHPPLILPQGSFPAGAAHPPVLGFVPAPTVPADRLLPAAAPEDRPALTRPRGRLQIGWYEAAIVALILGCAALCVYRLIWAIQI